MDSNPSLSLHSMCFWHWTVIHLSLSELIHSAFHLHYSHKNCIAFAFIQSYYALSITTVMVKLILFNPIEMRIQLQISFSWISVQFHLWLCLHFSLDYNPNLLTRANSLNIFATKIACKHDSCNWSNPHFPLPLKWQTSVICILKFSAGLVFCHMDGNVITNCSLNFISGSAPL